MSDFSFIYITTLKGFAPFAPELRPWWEGLKTPSLEKVRILTDLETLAFAQKQKSLLENSLAEYAAEDERIPLLVQVPGIGMLTAITILGAVGEIKRFKLSTSGLPPTR